MKVTRCKTEDLSIVDEASGERLDVKFVDEAPGRGRITIVGGGKSSTCYWNNMGNLTVQEFFLMASDSYIVGCLDPFGTLFRKLDPTKLTEIVVTDIAESGTLDDEQKLALSVRTAEFYPISDVNGLVALNAELMTAIYGPMWTNQVNERFLGQHPLYTALFTQVATIRQVLQG